MHIYANPARFLRLARPLTGWLGWSGAVLAGDEFGVSLQWDASTLPYLTQWKNFRTTTYVCGIEPGNCLPEGQRAAQEEPRHRVTPREAR